MDLSNRYNSKESEEKWGRFWEENHLFHTEVNPDKEPFTVVIPPPNITGILHMGHALNNTLQDILVRYKRMKGLETLWMAGTDHAGIATQNVVEKQIAREGKKRQDLGREEFLKRLWAWQKQYGDTIIHQLKKLGSSCDWDRTRFTMDEHYSQVVTSVFVQLYEKKMIYRGQHIINWCPRCQTALSDEEAEHKEVKGALYHFRYPFKDDPAKYVTVATTRPETMLGDTAVAVHPKDKRYKKLIGKILILPLMNREIKIIADEYVDPKFGSGAVKVTPAHDPNDFEIGKRHDLEFINIMHPDARLNEKAGRFAGMDRFTARKEVVNALKELGALDRIEDHLHSVGHCYRCHTVVEPYLSKQWFVKMKPLAKPAIEVVKKKKIKFYPARWTKVYLNWMENIRDWCISRQIWWGHRIPVWYCPVCPEDKNVIVANMTPQECPRCHSKKLIQDEDVLDTWFSSWLWPFATLYWPQNKKDVEYFYPTSVLFTASEIIFFWVARMIMAGLEFTGKIPFSDVYIHGTVRDDKGQKMSKSLGNALDPLEIINEYGADALRFSLIMNSGQDLFISKDKFEIGRNFANKIWNATRLILKNVPDNMDFQKQFAKLKPKDLDRESCWIISRFHSTLAAVSRAIEQYRFSEAETLIYEFFWGNYCDWYLEMSKDKLAQETTQVVALSVLEQSLKMMHPFMPFVTEEIASKLPGHQGSLVRQSWPNLKKRLIDREIETQMQRLIEIIVAVRNLRKELNIALMEQIDITFSVDKEDIAFIEDYSPVLKKIAKINHLSCTTKDQESIPPLAKIAVVGTIKCFIPVCVEDIQKEKEKIEIQYQQKLAALERVKARLQNADFLQKAPAPVVEKDKLTQETLEREIEELKRTIDRFSSR